MYEKLGNSAQILAGGTDLLVRMKFREITPHHVVDISHIPGLRYVKLDERKNLLIGALTTVRQLEDPLIKERYPAISEAVESFASVPVREMATVGGNLCNASPSADLAPPLMVAEGKLKITGPNGTRVIQIEEFFEGPSESALRRGEILTEIQVPTPKTGTGARFIKVARSMQDLAKVNVAVLVRIDKGVVTKARIALGAVAPFPMRARKAEKNLEGKKINEAILEEVKETAAGETKPITDVRSTAEYRRKLCGTLVKRALVTAIERAKRQGR
jgi:carbon-monoxide dehydrogenase medium subunit